MHHLVSPKLLAAACAATLTLSLATAADTERVEHSFPLKADGRVRVENVNGRIEVRAWAGDGVKLEAVKEGRTAEVVAGIKIHTQSTADGLSIKTELAKIRRGWWRGNSHEGTVNYVLQVPAGATLEKIATVNGQVTVADIRGSVNASAVNGNIKASGLTGNAELETVNGSIHAEHATVAADGRVNASTVNGGIDVWLPADVSATLDASTVNGAVRSDIPFTVTSKHSRRSVEARLGAGGATLRLSTVNGGIRLQSAADEHAAAR